MVTRHHAEQSWRGRWHLGEGPCRSRARMLGHRWELGCMGTTWGVGAAVLLLQEEGKGPAHA